MSTMELAETVQQRGMPHAHLVPSLAGARIREVSKAFWFTLLRLVLGPMSILTADINHYAAQGCPAKTGTSPRCDHGRWLFLIRQRKLLSGEIIGLRHCIGCGAVSKHCVLLAGLFLYKQVVSGFNDIFRESLTDHPQLLSRLEACIAEVSF